MKSCQENVPRITSVKSTKLQDSLSSKKTIVVTWIGKYVKNNYTFCTVNIVFPSGRCKEIIYKIDRPINNDANAMFLILYRLGTTKEEKIVFVSQNKIFNEFVKKSSTEITVTNEFSYVHKIVLELCGDEKVICCTSSPFRGNKR